MNKVPKRLPLASKSVWYYRDNFPEERPFKLVSIFCHKNYAIDMHSHDFYELNLTISGHGVHYTNSCSTPIGEGDVVIVPPKNYHGYYNIEGLRVFHVLLHKNYFNKYAEDLNLLPTFHLLFNQDPNLPGAQQLLQFHVQGQVYQELLSFLWQLDELEQATNRKPDRADYVLTYSLTTAFLVRLCKEYARQHNTAEKADRSGDVGIIAVSEHIRSNYHEKITLEDLCRVSMMSKTQLYAKFKKYYGVTPLDYVNRYRILVAKSIIMETDTPLALIAQKTGFFDVSHFLKTYQKFENESPTELRRRLNRNIMATNSSK